MVVQPMTSTSAICCEVLHKITSSEAMTVEPLQYRRLKSTQTSETQSRVVLNRLWGNDCGASSIRTSEAHSKVRHWPAISNQHSALSTCPYTFIHRLWPFCDKFVTHFKWKEDTKFSAGFFYTFPVTFLWLICDSLFVTHLKWTEDTKFSAGFFYTFPMTLLWPFCDSLQMERGHTTARVGQNHKSTVYIRHYWQGTHQIYGHTRRIYTILANPNHCCSWSGRFVHFSTGFFFYTLSVTFLWLICDLPR
jgi:hypothetical protein